MKELKLPENNKKPSKFKQFLLKIKEKCTKMLQNDEVKAILSFLGEIIMLGLLASLALMTFGVSFVLLGIISKGSLLWLIKEKIFPMFSRLIGSINLVTVNNR